MKSHVCPYHFRALEKHIPRKLNNTTERSISVSKLTSFKRYKHGSTKEDQLSIIYYIINYKTTTTFLLEIFRKDT